MLQIYIVVADLHYSFKLRNFKGSIIYPVILSSMYNHDDETVDKQMKHQLKEDYIYKQDFVTSIDHHVIFNKFNLLVAIN